MIDISPCVVLFQNKASWVVRSPFQDVMAAKKLDPDKSLPWGLSPEGLAPGSMKVSKSLIF